MSDIRFNQWLHQSGTGGVSQSDGGHVGIGTTNPLLPVGAGNTHILHVGVVTSNSISAGSSITATTFYGSGANLTSLPAAQLTGALPAISGVNLTGIALTSLNISGNVDNRVITATGNQYTAQGEANVQIDSTGRLLVGTGAAANPKSSGAGSIDLDNQAFSIMVGGNHPSGGRSNNNAKTFRMSMVHYTLAEEPINILQGYCDNSDNNVYIGGGTGSANSLTSVRIYTGANNTTTGGTERFRIHSAGQIGLSGANYGSSGQVLTSGGSGSAATWSTVSGTTINNNADNRIITGSGTANTLEGEANLTYGGGNLQFTTTANGQQVLLKSTGNYYNKLSFDSGNTSAGGELAYIDFSWDGDKVADIHAMAGSDTTNKDDGHLVFRTSPSQGNIAERMRIASDGEIFMGANFGTTNRSTLLSISGANQDPAGVWTQVGIYADGGVGVNKGGSIGFGGPDGSVSQQQFSAIKGAKENANSGDYAGYMAFYTRPSGAVSQERMRIKSNGVVDINGMFCAGKPGNFGSVSSTQGCRITGQQGSHPACLSFDGGGTPTLELGSTSGQTIIGTNGYGSSPMNFKTGMAIATLSGGTTRFQINTNGNIGAPTGNNIYNASDERLKENMVELTDGLSKIQKLKPISFTWKEGWDVNLDGKKEYGFGAQTTEVVDKMLVEPFSLDDAELNGEIIEKPLRVNEKYIIPLLVKAVQELSAKVAALEGS